MRYFGYTLAPETDDIMEMPSQDVIERMDQFMEDAIKAGVYITGGGIAPTAMGFKVTLADGEFTVVDGPFTEAKEIVGGWAITEYRDKEEAIEWTKRFLSVLGKGESRVRPLFGRDDMGEEHEL